MTDELDNSLFSKVYVLAPSKPGWFDPAVLRIGGSNPFGEPRLKVGWGMDLRTFRRGDPRAIKYRGPHSAVLGIDRWILEVWRPSEFYGAPSDWESHRYMFGGTSGRVDLLGDYPSRGVYVMSTPITGPAGEFKELDQEVIAWLEFNHQAQATQPFNAYTTLRGFAELQEKMAEDEAAQYAEADREADERAEYYNKNAHRINQDIKYSLPAETLSKGRRLLDKGAGH